MMDETSVGVAALISSAAACLLLASAEEVKKSKTKKRKRCWAKEHRRSNHLASAPNLIGIKPNLTNYKAFLGMDQDCFNLLLSRIRNDIRKQTTRMRDPINPEEKLAITLRYLEMGESLKQMESYSTFSKSFLSKAIIEVCEAIYKNLKDEFLKFPTFEEEWLKIAADYGLKWQFPYCVGALGSKHIAFRPLIQNAQLFYNSEGYKSIVLLGLVDAHYKFIFIDVGCNGGVKDNSVLIRSNLMHVLKKPHKFLPPKNLVGNSLLPHVFVADNNFPLLENLMVPYPHSTTDMCEKAFNYRLSRAHQTIDHAFEILSNRFRIFQKTINIREEDKVNKIVQCCCVLHNFLITKSRFYIKNNSFENYHPFEENENNCLSQTEDSTAGKVARTELLNYFNNEGKLC